MTRPRTGEEHRRVGREPQRRDSTGVSDLGTEVGEGGEVGVNSLANVHQASEGDGRVEALTGEAFSCPAGEESVSKLVLNNKRE